MIAPIVLIITSIIFGVGLIGLIGFVVAEAVDGDKDAQKFILVLVLIILFVAFAWSLTEVTS